MNLFNKVCDNFLYYRIVCINKFLCNSRGIINCDTHISFIYFNFNSLIFVFYIVKILNIVVNRKDVELYLIQPITAHKKTNKKSKANVSMCSCDCGICWVSSKIQSLNVSDLHVTSAAIKGWDQIESGAGWTRLFRVLRLLLAFAAAG